MFWISIVLSFFQLLTLGDEISAVATASNGDVLVVGSIQVPSEDDQESLSQVDTYIARLTPDTKTIVWEKSYGWIKDDHANAVGVHADGTIQVVGDTWSTGNGYSDGYVFLLDSKGEMLWEQDIGGQGIDTFHGCALVNSTVVAVGSSASYAGTMDGLPWMVKLDHEGQILWNIVLGKDNAGRFWDVVRVRGGVVAVGEMNDAVDFEETDSAVTHVLVAKFSDAGSLLWEKHYAIGFDPQARSVVRLSDNGFIIAGSTQTSPTTSRNGFLLRLTASGSVVWTKTYGGVADDAFHDLIRLPNQRLVAIGTTYSFGANAGAVWMRGVTTDGMSFLHSVIATPSVIGSVSALTVLSDDSLAFASGSSIGRLTLSLP